MNVKNVPIDHILGDPKNPRQLVSAEELQALAECLKQHGVKVPLLGYIVANGVMLADGHRRFEAAKLAGLTELPVVLFDEKPDEGQILSTQLVIGKFRSDLNPLDELAAISRLMRLRNWSPSDLAKGLNISPSEVTRLLALAKLTPDEQQLVRDGKLSKSAGYALSRMPGEQRGEFARKAAAGEITRDQLNSQARRKRGTDDVKTKRVCFEIKQVAITVEAPQELSGEEMIEVFETAVREWRKATSQGLNTQTTVRVLRDRNRKAATNC